MEKKHIPKAMGTCPKHVPVQLRMMLRLIGYQIKIKSSRFQSNPRRGEFLLKGTHLSMIGSPLVVYVSQKEARVTYLVRGGTYHL